MKKFFSKKKSKLAIYGGKKVYNLKKKFIFKWPPNNKKKIQSVVNYLKKNEEQNKCGYPKVVENFEKAFKKKLNTKFALSFNSGTSAIFSSFFAIGLKEGDEVLAPTITFHATATPILKYKAKVILCDCDLDTGNISVEDIKKKINKKTKAIIITHLGGHPCEMDEIVKICKQKKIYLIEDCSHAHLSKYKNKFVGTFGDIGVFSIDRNKLLSAGEGGVIVTNNRLFYERAFLTSDFGPKLDLIKNIKLKNFKETGFGYKFRIHPLSAAIALSELKKISRYSKERKKNLTYLTKRITKEIPGLIPPITYSYCDRGAFYSYRVFYDNSFFKRDVNFFIKALQAEGLDVRKSGNRPLHQLPYFFKKNKKRIRLKNAEKYYNSTFSLPTFTFEKKYIINIYIKAIKKITNYIYI